MVTDMIGNGRFVERVALGLVILVILVWVWVIIMVTGYLMDWLL